MEKSNPIVVFWSEGFPHEISASNEKHKLMAKALADIGYVVYLTSKKPFQHSEIMYGIHEGLKYFNFHKKGNSLTYLSYLNSTFKEICFFKKLRRKNNRVYLIGNYSPFLFYTMYFVVCKFLKIKLVLNIMEWHISIYKNSKFIKKCNAFLFDKIAVFMSDGIIVISDLIYEKLSKTIYEKKIVKIPVITDIQLIDSIVKISIFPFKYVLYCGSISYLEVITLIVVSFNKLVDSGLSLEIHLVLVIQGSEGKISTFKNWILNDKYSERIHIYSKLDYSTLIQFYKNAELLLVPLRDTVQDKARYPQKIAEYTACERPIISNNIGQVGIDFQHKKNIFFAPDFSVEAISDSMNEVLRKLGHYEIMASNAKDKCKTYFHYSNYGTEMDRFLSLL